GGRAAFRACAPRGRSASAPTSTFRRGATNPKRAAERTIHAPPMISSVDSTSVLIPAVARGDMAAFEAVYDRYSGTLYALLLRILGNAEDAQEVLQEAFVKVWTTARMFDPARGSEVAWLISIARSKGIDKLRS